VVRDGRSKIGGMVHGPEGSGPLYEFAAPVEVANFLAFGDTKACRRSVVKARRAHTGDNVEGSPAPAAPKDPSGLAGPLEGARRTRYLPMLGDQAGE
jgi:hypothetical protein